MGFVIPASLKGADLEGFEYSDTGGQLDYVRGPLTPKAASPSLPFTPPPTTARCPALCPALPAARWSPPPAWTRTIWPPNTEWSTSKASPPGTGPWTSSAWRTPGFGTICSKRRIVCACCERGPEPRLQTGAETGVAPWVAPTLLYFCPSPPFAGGSILIIDKDPPLAL